MNIIFLLQKIYLKVLLKYANQNLLKLNSKPYDDNEVVVYNIITLKLQSVKSTIKQLLQIAVIIITRKLITNIKNSDRETYLNHEIRNKNKQTI